MTERVRCEVATLRKPRGTAQRPFPTVMTQHFPKSGGGWSPWLSLWRLTPQNLFWLVEGVPWLELSSVCETEGVYTKLLTAHEAASLLFTPSVKTCGFATSLGEGGNGRRNILRNPAAGGLYIIRRQSRLLHSHEVRISLARRANFTRPQVGFHRAHRARFH